MHCRDITRAILDTFYKRNKKTCSSGIVELYKHLRVFKNTPAAHASLALLLSRVLKNFEVLI